MKHKTIILSVIALLLTAITLLGVNSPLKKPIPAKELVFAEEEIIEYTLEEGNQNSIEDIEEEGNDFSTCVSIIGSAKVSLSPDIATITACIEKFNEDINISKNQTLDILNEIKEKLLNNEIKKENFSLDFFSTHPSYDFNTNRQPIGYYTKACISFKVENLDNISKYINILTENGVTDICDICYSLSNLEEEYNNVLVKAVENAKNKASKLFNKEGIICEIKEEAIYSCNSLCREYTQNISSDLIGQVEIEAKVNVLFKI